MAPRATRAPPALMLLFALAVEAAAAAAVAPAGRVVSWMSEPALPGETALLQVASPAASTRLSNASLLEVRQGDGEWSAVPMSGMTAAGGAFEVPASFAPAAFEVRVDGGSAFAANVPRPWFAFGDLGETATQGGSVRIVGEALTLLRDSTATPPLLRLAPVAAVAPAAAAAAAAAIVLVARASLDGGGVGAALTRWQAYFDLPAALAPGNYSLAIAHGGGSGSDDTGGAAANASAFEPLCTFVDQDRPCRSTIRVTAAGTALADPRTTFGATDTFVVNATQPGAGRDATAAVAAAVAAASAHLAGGAERALVHFPRGQYFVQGPILVAPGTVLRGERRDLVSIYFAEDNATSAPAAYVSSTRPGAWGLEGVTLYVTAFANSIVRFTPGTAGAFLRRSTIRFNSYFCLEPAKGQGSRGRTSGWEHDVGVAVTLAGKSLFVQDNDIFSSGDVVSSRNNGAAGAAYMHISRNRFWNGGTTHWGISWKQCIYEDNEATGVSTTAMGSNYPQYAHSDGEPHVQNILHTNNSQNMVWGNDREMMTCDGGGGVYWGAARSDGVVVTLPTKATGTQPGGAMCVLSGAATGECRRVLGNAAAAPTPPPSPGPAPVRPMSPLGLVLCAAASALRPPSAASNGTIVYDAEPTFSVVTLCDPPGEPSGSDMCGKQKNDEPLLLDHTDAWTSAYGTAAFAWDSATGQITLAKSGKCATAAANGQTLVLTSSCSAATQWTYDAATKRFAFAAQPGRCIGVTGPPPPAPASDLTRWVVNRAFSVELDGTSNVTIMPYIGQIAFNGNRYADGGEVQFYAQALGVVAAENTFERTGGLSAWARGYSGKDANLRNSFIDNEVLEGNHVWNYNTHPNPGEDPSLYPYFPGGSKTVEPWFFASLTNEQGPPIDPSPKGDFDGAFNRFITFRGNKVHSNGGIVVRGTSANVLVERNVIKDSAVGIHVNYSTTQGGIVIRNNVEPPGVPDNFNPYA